MKTPPHDLHENLRRHGQEHVLAWWDELNPQERQNLARQLESVDLDHVMQLYQQRETKYALPAHDRIAPLPWPDATVNDEHRRRGEQAFRSGGLAFLVVAGGQGSRLGFEHPKGMFPVGPVTNKTLFQIHVEKIVALRRRFQADIPLLVMTSPATHTETEAFFQQHRNFGLPESAVSFFCQGTMPALDLLTGKLILQSKKELFLSPNGHGGTLTGLESSGLLRKLQERGVRTIYYFQVDNPLVNLADLDFIGRHSAHNAEVSSKVIAKQTPTEKLGNFVLIDGRCSMIEYSDLPEDLAQQRDEQGRLRLWAGSPAIHLFDVSFLDKVVKKKLPWHLARKKVPFLHESGQVVEPDKENALKFEMFIFDVLPLAERWTVVNTTRRDEFEPLKNAEGADSPQSVRRAISNQAADWLEQAGAVVPRDAAGSSAVPLEISPLFALDARELAEKVERGLRIDKATYLE
jgi:UDP-N-acetylglucosamine/UDP-N-acetylgalactosamine diphosphorylase